MGTESLFQLTFPPVTVLDSVVWTLLAVVAGCLWIYVWISASARKDQSKELGDLFGMSPGIAVAITVIIAPLFLAALAASFSVLLRTVVNPSLATGLGTGALIAATLGAPFLIWRSIVAQKTVDHAAKSLFNDKINAAVQDLYSQRQVTWTNDKGEHFNAWEDDVVKRIAAIERLYILAEEVAETNPKEVARIGSMLSTYARELSQRPDLAPNRPPSTGDSKELLNWFNELQSARLDIISAAKTLILIPSLIEGGNVEINLDLSGTNLQRSNLSFVEVSGARLDGAFLDGSRLEHSDFRMASFAECSLFGVSIEHSEFDRCNFFRSDLRGLVARESEFLRCWLNEVRFEGTSFTNTWFGETLLGASYESQVLKVDCCRFRGSAIRSIGDDLLLVAEDCLLDGIFADGSVKLAESSDRPRHWSNEKLPWRVFLAAFESRKKHTGPSH